MSLNNQFNTKTKDIKIIVVGNSGTGKTSFCNRWVKNDYTDIYKATIMSHFSYKIYQYNGIAYKVQLWDLAGQDRNISISKIISKNCHGCLIFSDVTEETSLKDTLKWKEAIVNDSYFIDGNQLPCLLIQNKYDLIDKVDKCCEVNLNDFAKKNGFIQGIKTSVKEGRGIDEAMDCLLNNIIQRLDAYAKTISLTGSIEERKSEFSSLREKATFMNPEEKSRCC